MKKSVFPALCLILILQTAALSKELVRAYFFYSPGCLQCLTAKDYVKSLQNDYPLEVKYLNTDIMENYEAMLYLEKKFNVIKGDIPEVFIGQAAFSGIKEIKENLKTNIIALLERGGSSWPDDIQADSGRLIEERFASFTLLTVLSAGLIDGINPCAFATIVFFVSFLSFAGRKKKDILLIGSCFSLAVFLTYLLIGLGVFRIMHSLEFFFLLSREIFYIVGIIAISLGILNLYDYYRYRRGKISEMTLQLPGVVKRIIHAAIRINRTTSGLPLMAVAAATGFLVSVLESICTGQVYLPTIVFILKTQGIEARAFSFLILYNLMFIFPLILIFGLAFLGATSEWFGGMMKKNLGLIKILSALFFFGLGVLLFAM
jgi:hypothetical protein